MNPALAAQTSSPFPNPPEYAQQYTDDNIEKNVTKDPPAPHLEFRVFGEEYRLDDEVIGSLALSGIRELYANKNNWKAEMKKLNRSAVVAFMDIVELLIRSPDHPFREEKIQDLHTIFINMHHLINEFRPVQARATIKLLQDEQIENLTETCEQFDEYMKDAKKVLDQQFKLIKTKLKVVPDPKPETRIMKTSGGDLVAIRVDGQKKEKRKEDEAQNTTEEASEEMEKTEEEETTKVELLSEIKEKAHRQTARTTILHNLERQMCDLNML